MAVDVQIEERFLDLSHGKSRILEAGNGYPTILVHGAGFLSSADNWLGVIRPLAEKLHVISIDALNFGKGDIFDQEFSFAYMVDHIREIHRRAWLRKGELRRPLDGWLAGHAFRLRKPASHQQAGARGSRRHSGASAHLDGRLEAAERGRHPEERRARHVRRGPCQDSAGLHREARQGRARRGLRQGDEAHDEPRNAGSLQHHAAAEVDPGADAGALGLRRQDQRRLDGPRARGQHPQREAHRL